jgi:hypothetical protein
MNPEQPGIDVNRQDRAQARRGGFVYLMKAGDAYKIGIARNVERRRDAIQTGSPVPVFVIAAAFVNDPRWVEAGLHQEFAACRLEGEWFALDQRSVADVIRLLVDAEMTGV